MYVIMKMGRCHLKMLAGRRRHHLDRDKLKSREHPERQKYNSYKEFGGTLYEQARELLKQHKEVTGRKARTDAVVMIDFVFTVSPEARYELLENKNEWIQAQIKWVKKNFSHSKFCGLFYEEDETTPHLHVYVSATEEKGNLNAKKIIGNASKMASYQESYEQFMIESGIFQNITKRTKQKSRPKNKKVHNVPIRKYKQQQLEEIEKLNDEIKELKKQKEDIESYVLDDKKEYNTKSNERLILADDILL